MLHIIWTLIVWIILIPALMALIVILGVIFYDTLYDD